MLQSIQMLLLLNGKHVLKMDGLGSQFNLEEKHHINILELKAALYGLRSLVDR